jgi:DNA-binding NarL/FixJ family response regulator
MIRIAIVDDHAMIRAGLQQFFADQPDFTVVARSGQSGAMRSTSCARRGRRHRARHLHARPERRRRAGRHQGTRARPAGAHPERLSRGALRDHAAAPGASGYLNKDCDPEEIVKAIRTVARGRKYITAGVAERLADGLGGGGDKPLHEQLSEREFQVFLRLAKGETISHMADSMSLSVKTVSTYRTRVMEKMKLESNSDLTYYALKNGLIQ